MTYVSRRTRITVSRWTDECDAEYLLRASRKRSDGRLKRYTSCDDPRAWINDNCIKNEYLVDLMSNGEFLGKPSFQLFGRFIPVPILFKLAQSSATSNDETKSQEKQGENVANNRRKCDSRNENYRAENDSILTTVQWEKNVLEKNLVKCTCLLNKALRKLEQIDDIVGPVNDEIKNSRNEEIREAFCKSKLSCICYQNQSSSARSSSYYFSENLSSSKTNLKMQRAKRTELLRKISDLRKKLKKICLQEVIHQIRTPQRTDEKFSSHFQATEPCNCPKKAQIKGWKKNNVNLKAEKEKLLSEMCQAFTALNAIKKCSKSHLESRKRNSIPNGDCDDFRNKELREFEDCNCGCKSSEKFFDSEKLECFESFSEYSDLNKKFDEPEQIEKDFCFDYQTSSSDYRFKSSLDCKNLDLEKSSEGIFNSAACTEALEINSKCSESKDASGFKNPKCYEQSGSLPQKKSENSKEKKEKREPLKTIKKSKVKFICEESPCRKNIYADDLFAFENSLSNQMIILKAVKNIQSFRPSTTPTTKRERLDSQNFTDELNFNTLGNIPERRVKSETTMKEIEKTLRNYEQRLCDVESLEYRIEQLKEKSSEACQLRKRLKKVKADAKNQRSADRENSNRERIRLCSENWELRKKIQRLTKRSVAQIHSIKNLNYILMKFKCETEELRKELSEYQVGFENQQNYIYKCENTLAKWGAEIENLKDHIRKLTAMNEAPCSQCQNSRWIQRSKSYIPEKTKERVMTNRPKTQARGYRTLLEEVPCCCREYEHLRGSMNFQQRLLLPIREKCELK